MSGAAGRCAVRSGSPLAFAPGRRTTLHPALLAEADVEQLAATLAHAGVRHYALQMFRAQGCASAALVHSAAQGHLSDAAQGRIAARFDSFTLRLA